MKYRLVSQARINSLVWAEDGTGGSHFRSQGIRIYTSSNVQKPSTSDHSYISSL